MKHPCDGLSKVQREAFERVASGGIPNCKWCDIDVLMAHGLLARGQNQMQRDAMGVYYVPHFYLPPHARADWKAWCDEKLREALQ